MPAALPINLLLRRAGLLGAEGAPKPPLVIPFAQGRTISRSFR